MDIKPKLCACGCKQKFTPFKSTDRFVDHTHYKHWLLNSDAGKRKVAKAAKDAIKLRVIAEKRESKKQKDAITNWGQKLQTVVQEIARIIDYGQPCLARGSVNGQFHGGHVFSRGANANFKFNLHNIHRQSAQSNHWQNDDALMRKGLEYEYGLPYFEFVQGLKQTPPSMFTNDELMVVYAKALALRNRLKKELKVYGVEDRISMRNECNVALGVYDGVYCEFVYPK